MAQIVRDAETGATQAVGPTGGAETAGGAITQGEME
jgi:hypothetical protein